MHLVTSCVNAARQHGATERSVLLSNCPDLIKGDMKEETPAVDLSSLFLADVYSNLNMQVTTSLSCKSPKEDVFLTDYVHRHEEEYIPSSLTLLG